MDLPASHQAPPREPAVRRHRVRLAGREIALPQSSSVRIAIGVALVLGGLLGFLPILGFWMIPLGLLVLSVDLPLVRRWRRRLFVWLQRRYPRLSARPPDTSAPRRLPPDADRP